MNPFCREYFIPTHYFSARQKTTSPHPLRKVLLAFDRKKKLPCSPNFIVSHQLGLISLLLLQKIFPVD
jgi:hypothetical protein